MRRPNTVNYRNFACSCCNTKMIVPEIKRKYSPKGHIKTMYCYKCKANSDFIMESSMLLRN